MAISLPGLPIDVDWFHKNKVALNDDDHNHRSNNDVGDRGDDDGGDRADDDGD